MKPTPAALAVGLLIAGCSGQDTRPDSTDVTHIPEEGGWFCQLAPSGEGWQCVQDPQLASNPQPSRIPSPEPPDEPTPAPLTIPEEGPTTPGPPRQPRASLDPDEPPPPPEAEPPADQAAAPEPAPADPAAPVPAEPPVRTDDRAAPAALPEYARLAYQPEQAMNLTDLPEDFYAVQVLAMSTAEEVEAFVDRHGIQRVSAARVERDGELYYVLLLGVYENRETAQRAIADLPAPFADTTPWIRPLGSLQSAMRRADALASAGNF